MWYEGKTYKSLIAVLAITRWLVVAVVFGFGVYIYQRDVNAQTTVNLSDVQRELTETRALINERKAERDRQIDVLSSHMLTKEVFDERSAAINQRLDRIEHMTEQILLKQGGGNP
jgi:hypothetical protein